MFSLEYACRRTGSPGQSGSVPAMKLFSITVATLALTNLASADYIGMSAELVGTNLLQDSSVSNYTIRVYAEVEQGDRIDGVFGVPDQPMFLEPGNGTSFYQDFYGGPTSKSINPNFFDLVPDLQWDSFVTIGALDQSGDPFGSNTMADVGIDWETFEAGQDMQADDGIWFVTPDDPQGESINSRVLIAQLTILSPNGRFELPRIGANFIGHDAEFNSWQAWGELYWIPAPATIGLLPMVMLSGRRRRRG